MARLPDRYNLSGPEPLRSGRMISVADETAIGRGLQSFGGAVAETGQVLAAKAEKERQRGLAVDLARANAFQDQENIRALNDFDQDPDFGTFGDRGRARTQQIAATAAEMIRDPEARELFTIQASTTAARVGDTIGDRGVQLQQQADVVSFDEALEANRRIYIDPNSTPEAKDKARASIEGALSVGLGSGLLTPAMADERRTAYLEGADFTRAKLDPSLGAAPDAAAVIRNFEGFRSTPYWDVNANRVGYGSDTITREDGSVVRVTPGMAVSRADAERDLERRIADFQGGIVENIGQVRWDGLPSNVQAALTSVAYNYGSLPRNVIAAIKTGDVGQIAASVEALGDDNGGVNSDRRRQEAELIRGQAEPEWFRNMPADQRQVVYDMRAQEAAQAATAARAQQTAAYETHRSALELGILTGDVASEAQLLSDPMLNDNDTAELVRSFRAQQEKVTVAQSDAAAITDGTARDWNPYNSDHRTRVDSAYEEMVKSVAPESQQALGAAVAQVTGVVPSALVADIRQSLNSDDAGRVAAGMEQAAALYDAVPNGLRLATNGQELVDAASTYAEMVGERGMSVQDAAAESIARRDPANQRSRDLLKDAWNTVLSDTATTDPLFKIDDVLTAFDDSRGWTSGMPTAGVTELQAEGLMTAYLDAAERAFMGSAQGDAGLAKRIALDEMKSRFGVSLVSGGEVVMPYPPENYYPALDGDQTYIRDLALKAARGTDPAAQNVMLTAAPETSADVRAGRPPRYDLWYMDPETGVWEMTPDQFTLLGEDIEPLAALAGEERQIQFEIGRDVERAKEAARAAAMQSLVAGGPAAANMIQQGIAASGLNDPAVDPAAVVTDYPAKKARLDAIAAERRALLGQAMPDAVVDDVNQPAVDDLVTGQGIHAALMNEADATTANAVPAPAAASAPVAAPAPAVAEPATPEAELQALQEQADAQRAILDKAAAEGVSGEELRTIEAEYSRRVRLLNDAKVRMLEGEG